MKIVENYLKVKNSLPENVNLVVVTKFQSIDNILKLYELGHRDFGENRVQELVPKYNSLPKDINWHMIGHLQTNKVKYIAPFIYMIHSIDSLKLIEEVNKRAIQNNRIIDCLLEVHIAKEETKSGFLPDELIHLLEKNDLSQYNNIKICGLMTMATFTDDTSVISEEFSYFRDFFNTIKNKFFKENSEFHQISMGMSNDYLIAVNYGATIVRIGSKIFS